MSYKSELQSNNLDLQSILNTVNNLPEADATMTTETWTFTMEDGSTVTKEVAVNA